MAGTAGQEDAVLEARTAVASALALAAERGIAEGDDTRCDPLQQLARVRFFAWSICGGRNPEIKQELARLHTPPTNTTLS